MVIVDCGCAERTANHSNTFAVSAFGTLDLCLLVRCSYLLPFWLLLVVASRICLFFAFPWLCLAGLYIFSEKRDPTAVKRENPPTATLLEMLRNKLKVLTQSINLIVMFYEKRLEIILGDLKYVPPF